MADVVINGVTYPDVEAVALTDTEGNTTTFYPDAVRYVGQELTDEQKAQARQNIGANSAFEIGAEIFRQTVTIENGIGVLETFPELIDGKFYLLSVNGCSYACAATNLSAVFGIPYILIGDFNLMESGVIKGNNVCVGAPPILMSFLIEDKACAYPDYNGSCEIVINELSSDYKPVIISDMRTMRFVGEFDEGGEVFNGKYSGGSVNNSAKGNGSHAEGTECHANGVNSHVEGWHCVASGDNQHVQGRHNIEDTEGKYAHIVGNGKNHGELSNAHTLDWNGNAWFAGSVEGTAMILSSPGGKRFNVTVDDSGNLTATEITS